MKAAHYSRENHNTWKKTMDLHRQRREHQIAPMFMEGLKRLEMDLDYVPDLEYVNKKLRPLTGWEGVYVKGLVDFNVFANMLAQRKFPIGNFVRDQEDLSYTPEPDVIHDLYGHMPFFADKDYAYATQKFAETALKFADNKIHFDQFERVYWFGFEFGLLQTSHGKRIFGAGIASSVGECEYALSNQPQVIPFDVSVIRKRPFRTDLMQDTLFILKDVSQLYNCLPELSQFTG